MPTSHNSKCKVLKKNLFEAKDRKIIKNVALTCLKTQIDNITSMSYKDKFQHIEKNLWRFTK